MMVLGLIRDEAGNIGANNLTLSISLEEGVVQGPAARTATRDAALAASTGTVAVISVGAVSATTLAAGELQKKCVCIANSAQNVKWLS